MSAEFSRKMKEIAKRWDLLRAEYQDETESPAILSLYGMHPKPMLEKSESPREFIKIPSPAI